MQLTVTVTQLRLWLTDYHVIISHRSTSSLQDIPHNHLTKEAIFGDLHCMSDPPWETSPKLVEIVLPK